MLERQRITIAGGQTTHFSDIIITGLDEPIAYHDSDIVTDFCIALCNVQTSNELHENTSKG